MTYLTVEIITNVKWKQDFILFILTNMSLRGIVGLGPFLFILCEKLCLFESPSPKEEVEASISLQCEADALVKDSVFRLLLT